MTRIFASVSVLALLTACTKGSVSGTITDGLTGEPVAELRVLAKSDDTADLTCMVLEGTTDATGTFTIEGTCANSTYTLSSADDTRFFEGAQDVAGGEPITGHAITSYLAPAGKGVYLVKDGELKPQKTYSDVQQATILKTEQVVRYPDTKPKDDGWNELPEGAHLLLLGDKNINSLQWQTANESPEIKFEPDREGITHFSLGQPWVYIGIDMQSETEFAETEPQVDESKYVAVEGGGRKAVYVPAEALAPGRYALLPDEKARRTYLFEVK